MITYRSRYHGDNPVGEENICTALDMAVWFGRTERKIINTNIATTPTPLTANVRRVRVGNIYMYRLWIENTTDGFIKFPVGDYLLATPDDLPELPKYEFSNQMGMPTFSFNATTKGIASIYSMVGQVTPSGVFLHVGTETSLTAKCAIMSEATRSQMGPWAIT